MLDIICLAAMVYRPSFSSWSKTQRTPMAISAVMTGLMPSKGTKTANCSFAQVQKRSIPKSLTGNAVNEIGFAAKFVMPGHSRPKDGVASARLCPGHPRLSGISARKTWMAGTSPAMTKKRIAFKGLERVRKY
jgi:hypothetical protein